MSDRTGQRSSLGTGPVTDLSQKKRVVTVNVSRGDTWGWEGMKHLSAEVTPHRNTGFLNNRALGMRAAGERRDFGDQEQPQLKSPGVDWSFLAFTRRKLLEKFLKIETLIPMLSHNLLSELQMQVMHKSDIFKIRCQMRLQGKKLGCISPLWGRGGVSVTGASLLSIEEGTSDVCLFIFTLNLTQKIKASTRHYQFHKCSEG